MATDNENVFLNEYSESTLLTSFCSTLMVPLEHSVGFGLLFSFLLLASVGCGGGETDEGSGTESADSLDRAPAAQTSPDMPSDPVDSLSSAQRQRLGPALQRFLTGDTLATGDVKAVGTRDGENVFSVLIRSENADALREAGVPLTSVAGTIITARLTIDEILRAASVADVQSIRADQEMKPHSPSGSKKPSAPKNKSGSETMPSPETPSSGGASPSGGTAPSSGNGAGT